MAHILSEETSLTRKKDALRRETGVLGYVLKAEAVIAVLLFLGGAVMLWRGGSSSLVWLGAILGVICVGHHVKRNDNQREQKKTEAGLAGEAKVSALLAEALDNTHYIFNDVLVRHGRKSAQIDHLIVSPRGIFVLETKNWRGRIEGDEHDERWRQIKDPGEDPVWVSNPVRQCARHREFITGALKRAGIDWPDVHVLVVFMARTELAVRWTETPVLHPADAADYIRHLPVDRVYSEAEVSNTLNYFMKEIGRA